MGKKNPKEKSTPALPAIDTQESFSAGEDTPETTPNNISIEEDRPETS